MRGITVTAKEAGIAAGAAGVAFCLAAGIGYLFGLFPGKQATFGASAYDAESVNAMIRQWSAAIIAILTIAIRNVPAAWQAVLATLYEIVAKAYADAKKASGDVPADESPVENSALSEIHAGISRIETAIVELTVAVKGKT